MYRKELEDMEILSSSNLPFKEYQNAVFLVTGATGLIGSLIVKNLLFCNKRHNLGLKIVAVVRNVQKAEKILKDFKDDSSLIFELCDLLNEKIKYKGKIDYIIHTAAVTQSRLMVEKPVETVQLSLYSTDRLLDLAAKRQVRCFLYVSSMEVYGIMEKNEKVGEHELGYIDLESVRSCYPESKRMCELLCNSYAAEYNVPVKIARLAQTFGAGILESENRVFAQFARSVLKGKDIVLHTKGESEGNYVYTRDAIKAIFILLANKEKTGTYNISNESSHTTIAKLAGFVAREIGEDCIKVVYDIPENSESYGYAPDTKLFLDSAKMRQLGWQPEVGLKESFMRMMEDLAEMEKE